MFRILIFTFHIGIWVGCFSRPGEKNISLAKVSDSLELFSPGFISSPLYERDIAISPQGDEIIFTRGDIRQHHRCLIRIKKIREGVWGEMEILPFSGEYQDIEPFISPQGDLLYFASNRPMYGGEKKDYNIWVAEKKEGQWVNPMALDTIVNTGGDEFYPSVTRSGNLYFTAMRDDGKGLEDIFLSKKIDGKYQQPQPLDTAINSPTYEFNAYISPDESLIIFSSYGRPDDIGGGDLYYSSKVDGNWVKAENLHPVNSPQLDYCPYIDFNNGVFYFTSERYVSPGVIAAPDDLFTLFEQPGNGLGDLFRIKLEELPFR